jgi:4-hydroxybenzoyl-CoA reductase beta subunit
MHLPRFTYVRPDSRDEAAGLLDKFGKAAVLVAGGTDLFPRMKYRISTPEYLVSLSGVTRFLPALDEDGALRIDALMSLGDLSRSPIVRTHAPLVSQAATCVASGQIRNAATLGGNLCLECRCLYYNQSHTFQFVEPCFKLGGDLCYFTPKGNRCWAIFASDVAPALLSLDAVICVTGGPGKQRRFPVAELYTGEALSPLTLLPSEIVTEIIVPSAFATGRYSFRKFSRRKGYEFAGLSVAVALQVADDGRTCRDARIAVGSVAGGPVRAAAAEAGLTGQDISNSETVRSAAATVAREIRPIAHHGYQAAHLRHCLEVEVRRALTEAAGPAPLTDV